MIDSHFKSEKLKAKKKTGSSCLVAIFFAKYKANLEIVQNVAQELPSWGLKPQTKHANYTSLLNCPLFLRASAGHNAELYLPHVKTPYIFKYTKHERSIPRGGEIQGIISDTERGFPMIFKIEIMFEHIFLPSSLKKKRIIGQKYMTCYSNGSILFYKDVSHKGFQFTNTNLNTLFKKHKIKFNQNLFEEYFNSMEKPPNHQQLSCGQSISPRRHMDTKHSRVLSY